MAEPNYCNSEMPNSETVSNCKRFSQYQLEEFSLDRNLFERFRYPDYCISIVEYIENKFRVRTESLGLS